MNIIRAHCRRSKGKKAYKQQYKLPINPSLKDKHYYILTYIFLTVLHYIIYKYKHMYNFFFFTKKQWFYNLDLFFTITFLEE